MNSENSGNGIATGILICIGILLILCLCSSSSCFILSIIGSVQQRDSNKIMNLEPAENFDSFDDLHNEMDY